MHRETKKKCRKCRLEWPLKDFALNRRHGLDSSNPSHRRATCKRCEITERNNVDPLSRKARDTLRRHAKRYSEKHGIPMNSAEFAEKFGWTVKRLEHMFRHAWENTCRYCQDPYKEMPRGYSEMTLDILNPSQDPYLANTDVCCYDCNRKKGTMDAAEFGEWQQGWKRREKELRSQPIRFEQSLLFPELFVKKDADT